MNPYEDRKQIKLEEVSQIDNEYVKDIICTDENLFQITEGGTSVSKIFFDRYLEKFEEYQNFTYIEEKIKSIEFTLKKLGCHLSISQENKELLSSNKMLSYENDGRSLLRKEAYESIKTALEFSDYYHRSNHMSMDVISTLLSDSYSSPVFVVDTVERILSDVSSKELVDKILEYFIIYLECFNLSQMKRISKFAKNSYFKSVFNKAIKHAEEKN